MQFKNKPGELKVLNGNFHIIDRNRGAIVNQVYWNRYVEEGTHLRMSMIMKHLRRTPGQCPQPDCAGVGVACSRNPDQMTWCVASQEIASA